MATNTKAGSNTKTTKSSASATTGASASADTSKKLNKGTTASAGAYSEAEAGAVAKAQKGNASVQMSELTPKWVRILTVENETNIAGPVIREIRSTRRHKSIFRYGSGWTDWYQRCQRKQVP
jgi:hypothetical protein